MLGFLFYIYPETKHLPYIARIEHFCVGINHSIYDKEVVYALAEGYFNGAIRARIEPIINQKINMVQKIIMKIFIEYLIGWRRERRK